MKTEQAKLTLLIPFQGWCVTGRGIHKHFSLFEFFKALKEKNRFNEQRTKCYCKCCDNELCSSNSHTRSVETERGAFEVYICSKCKVENIFEFSAPCPILVESIH